LQLKKIKRSAAQKAHSFVRIFIMKQHSYYRRETDGTLQYFVNGYLSRYDGPAEISYNGNSALTCKWWLCGVCYGMGAIGFWKMWNTLSETEQNDLNLQVWLAVYIGIPVQAD